MTSLSDPGLSDPGPGGDRRERGYCVAGKRTWLRIRREFEGGASVAWLSARYGPGQRTIASHSKAEGWRRKDLAALNDAELDANERVATPPPLVLPPRGGAGGLGGRGAARRTDADAAGPDEVDMGAQDGVGLALNGAIMALRRGLIGEAQAYARLAELLTRATRRVEAPGEAGTPDAGTPDAGTLDNGTDDAAMLYLANRLGISLD